jgi:hypothetical protein
MAACDTGTAPEQTPELDAETTLEDFQALYAVLTSGDLSGLRALEGRTPFDDGSSGIDAMASLATEDAGGDARAFVLDVAEGLIRAGETSAGPAKAPIISSTRSTSSCSSASSCSTPRTSALRGEPRQVHGDVREAGPREPPIE